MKNWLIIALVFFSMCKSKHSPEEDFIGRFSGKSDGITSSSKLKIEDGRLRGTVTMNGNSVTVKGSVNGKSSKGIVYDKAVDKEYDYTASIEYDELRMTIIVPEMNDRKLKLVMRREEENNPSPNSRSKGINEEFIGQWVHTEFLGGGEYSMTNETIMEFSSDGTVKSWPGRSIGPDYSKAEDRSKTSAAEWYTEGKELHLIDLDTKKDVTTYFTISSSGLLLSDGGSEKKLFKRRN